MRRALTEEGIQKLLTDHENGFKVPQLAERYGISTRTIWRILADAQAPRTIHPRRKRKIKKRSGRVLQPCGTNAGYARHKYRKEYPCEPCSGAHAAQQKEWHDQLGKKATRPSEAN